MNETKLLLGLIRSELFPKEDCLPVEIGDDTLKILYNLSQKHDVTQILANVVIKNKLTKNPEAEKLLNSKKMLAVWRREQLDFEENRVYTLFDREGIDYIPLKGAVIKKLYPEQWMRTSCDIDILVRKEDIEKASDLLKEKLSFTDEGQHFHDRSFISKNNVHIELHFSLEEPFDKANNVLSKVWDYAEKKEGHRFELNNEFLIFHTVAHMQAHFAGGGCGIRPFIDLRLLSTKLDYSKEVLYKMLEEADSLVFFKAVLDLTSVWFDEKEHTSLTEDMELYITEGGAFGSRANYSAAVRHQKGGRLGYFLTRIFPPVAQMRSMFPKLNERPVLLPFYYVKRWFGLLNIKWAKNISHEFIKKEKADSVSEMMKKLGL